MPRHNSVARDPGDTGALSGVTVAFFGVDLSQEHTTARMQYPPATDGAHPIRSPSMIQRFFSQSLIDS